MTKIPTTTWISSYVRPHMSKSFTANKHVSTTVAMIPMLQLLDGGGAAAAGGAGDTGVAGVGGFAACVIFGTLRTSGPA